MTNSCTGRRINAAEDAVESRSCWYWINRLSHAGSGARGKQCRS
jgi:hypothetical protein